MTQVDERMMLTLEGRVGPAPFWSGHMVVFWSRESPNPAGQHLGGLIPAPRLTTSHMGAKPTSIHSRASLSLRDRCTSGSCYCKEVNELVSRRSLSSTGIRTNWPVLVSRRGRRVLWQFRISLRLGTKLKMQCSWGLHVLLHSARHMACSHRPPGPWRGVCI